jgi:dTMP kinase
LKSEKQVKAYLNDKEDIHENDFALQRAVKQEYEALCKLDHTIHRVYCADPTNHMRTIESIHNEIIEMINVKIS